MCFVSCRDTREDAAEDMDTDGVSLSASDRDDADDEPQAASERQTEAESEALGRGQRNLARSRSRGESEDEADLRAPPIATALVYLDQQSRKSFQLVYPNASGQYCSHCMHAQDFKSRSKKHTGVFSAPATFSAIEISASVTD